MGNNLSKPSSALLQVLKIRSDTPTHVNKILPFIHFVSHVNDQPINSRADIKQMLALWSKKDLHLRIIDSRNDTTEEVVILKQKEGQSLGMSVKFHEGGPFLISLCVAEIKNSSPAMKGGLINTQDYIIGVENVYLQNEDDFLNHLYKNIGNSVFLIVYNIGMQSLRRVEVLPEVDHLLGCELNSGMLYNIPDGDVFFDFECDTTRKEFYLQSQNEELGDKENLKVNDVILDEQNEKVPLNIIENNIDKNIINNEMNSVSEINNGNQNINTVPETAQLVDNSDVESLPVTETKLFSIIQTNNPPLGDVIHDKKKVENLIDTNDESNTILPVIVDDKLSDCTIDEFKVKSILALNNDIQNQSEIILDKDNNMVKADPSDIVVDYMVKADLSDIVVDNMVKADPSDIVVDNMVKADPSDIVVDNMVKADPSDIVVDYVSNNTEIVDNMVKANPSDIVVDYVSNNTEIVDHDVTPALTNGFMIPQKLETTPVIQDQQVSDLVEIDNKIHLNQQKNILDQFIENDSSDLNSFLGLNENGNKLFKSFDDQGDLDSKKTDENFAFDQKNPSIPLFNDGLVQSDNEPSSLVTDDINCHSDKLEIDKPELKISHNFETNNKPLQPDSVSIHENIRDLLCESLNDYSFDDVFSHQNITGFQFENSEEQQKISSTTHLNQEISTEQLQMNSKEDNLGLLGNQKNGENNFDIFGNQKGSSNSDPGSNGQGV